MIVCVFRPVTLPGLESFTGIFQVVLLYVFNILELVPVFSSSTSKL